MNNSQKPIARKDGLVIQEMPDEILVFDTETNKAHCLNSTAAFVWQACDGKNSIADIARSFGSYAKSPVQEDLIWLAIDQLNGNNLLAQELKADFNGQSRREVIKKIGLAAVISLPIISSLIAPVAAQGVTPNGGGRVSSSDCSTFQGASCTGNVVCQEGVGYTGTVGTCNGTTCVGTDCRKTLSAPTPTGKTTK
jgi:hypothetical protein